MARWKPLQRFPQTQSFREKDIDRDSYLDAWLENIERRGQEAQEPSQKCWEGFVMKYEKAWPKEEESLA